MQETIEKLYNGELYPSEQLEVRAKGYQEAKNTVLEAQQEFESKLCQAMKDELDEFMSKHMEASCFEDTQTFVNGFKLGARMMAEIFWDDKA